MDKQSILLPRTDIGSSFRHASANSRVLTQTLRFRTRRLKIRVRSAALKSVKKFHFKKQKNKHHRCCRRLSVGCCQFAVAVLSSADPIRKWKKKAELAKFTQKPSSPASTMALALRSLVQDFWASRLPGSEGIPPKRWTCRIPAKTMWVSISYCCISCICFSSLYICVCILFIRYKRDNK